MKKILVYLMLILPFTLLKGQEPQSYQGKLQFYIKSAEEYVNAGNKNLASNYYIKAAYLYWEGNDFTNAIKYFSESESLNKSIGNNNALKTLYFNLGMLYSELDKWGEAAVAFESAIKVSQAMGQEDNIAAGYLNLANALSNGGQYEKAIEAGNKALQYFLGIDNLSSIRSCYGALAETYERMGNTEKMVEYFDLFAAIDKKIKTMQMRDMEEKSQIEISIANREKEKTKEELELQTLKLQQTKDSLERSNLEMEKQRMENALKDMTLKEKDAKLAKRRTQIYGLFFIVLVIVLFSLFMYKLFRDKKKANKLLDLQNKQITSSIHYAERIQSAILPIDQTLNMAFDTFVIFQPKDIVSGDFYWYSSIKNGTLKNSHLFAVVDCTGHGVPGAFMSMIGNTLLNEIVNEKKVYAPSQILTLLNQEIRSVLKQEQTENNDGMDVSLCRIDLDDGKIKVLYSGAKRPLFVHTGNEVKIFEGDRFSIGGGSKHKANLKFTDEEIVISKGDILYLSSDGIIDQNAEDRKRFGTKRLIQEITATYTDSMDKQKENIWQAVTNHMQGVEQRDDITLLGIKIV